SPGDRAPLVPHDAALRHQGDPVAVAAEGAPDHLLGVAEAVHRRGVDAIDPGVEGPADRADRLLVLDGPVAVAAAHGPASEAHRGDPQPRPAERASLHRRSSRGRWNRCLSDPGARCWGAGPVPAAAPWHPRATLPR